MVPYMSLKKPVETGSAKPNVREVSLRTGLREVHRLVMYAGVI